MQTRTKSADKQQQQSPPKADAAVPRQKEPAVTPLITASDITATKTDVIVNDSLGDGMAQAGDTINYTINIQNNNVTDTATGVVLNDTVDPNTTIVANSIHAQPQARNETYSAVGNTLLEAGVAPSGNPAVTSAIDLFDNDSIATDTFALVSFQATSAQGGTVTVNADGSFIYLPAVGFTGTDTFTYTIRNTAATTPVLTDTATVTINVANRVWYVNNAAAAGGDGRSNAPFQTLTPVNGAGGGGDADAANDLIYLFTGATNYTTGSILENNQLLIGNGVALVVNTFTLRAAGSRPTLTNGAGNGVTLASGNTLSGFNIGDTSAIDISGTNFGTLTINNLTLGGTGRLLSLTTGALAATFDGLTSTSSSGGQAILLSAVTGSLTSTGGVAVTSPATQCILVTGSTVAASFGNTICTGGTDGVSFQNNSANTRTFGSLGVSGGSGNAFLHGAGGGNVTVTGAANLSSALNPIDIQNAGNGTAISFAGGATVSKTTAGGAGVNWGGTNTGATLTFASLALTTSNGSGLVAAGGGTINVTTGSISATGGGAQAAPAINANGVTFGASFTSVSSTNSGNAAAGNGIILTGVLGNLTMSSGSISGSSADAFRVNGGTANITYNGTITNTTARPVNIDNKTGGTVNFGAAVSGTSNGVLLNANGGATFNFTGGLNLSAGANEAFTATGGGTVNATQNNGTIVNTLTTTTGTALRVASTNIGASGLTFRSITSNGVATANGVVLDTTGIVAGTNGGLTITGNGGTCTSAATCTGGVITNKNGADASTTQGIGIYLNNTRDVSLTNVFLSDFQNYAIYGSSVTNFTFTTSRVTGTNGTSSNPTNEGCIRFDGLLGNALITGSNIGNTSVTTAGAGATNTLHVNNASGTLTLLDIQNSTIFNQNANATPGNSGQDAIFFGSPAGATGTMNLRLNNTALTHARQFLLQVNIQGTKTSNLEITNNTFHNVHTNVVSAGGGSNITGGGADVSVRYTISGNSFRQTGANNSGRAMTIGHAAGSAAFDGRFINNTIGQTGVAKSGAGDAADGLGVFASGNNSPSLGGSRILIQGNTIQRYGEAGIFINARQGNATLDATVFGNIIREPGTAALGAFAGIWVNSGALAADTNIVNVVIGAAAVPANRNTLTQTDPSNATDVFLDKNTCAGCASQIRLFQNGSDAAGATTEDRARDVLNDNNIGPLDLLTGFTNASAITFVAAGLPVQPTAPRRDIITGTDDDDQPAAPASVNAGQSLGRSDLTNPAAPFFIGAPVVAAQPVATGEAQAQATANLKRAQDADKKAAKSDTPDVQPLASAFPINIGTLTPNESITIVFSVTVNSNVPANVTQLSNQGMITGTNFAGTVLTDDPSVAGANNPTVTPFLQPPTITINNASAPEPASGSALMPFTVTLSSAYGSAVSVSFQTADGSATQPDDYTSTSGTITFNPGETLQTISVPIISDAAVESDENFTVTLNTPLNGTINGAGIGTGTITAANTPGTVLISELRTSGPGGPNDDFVELYNNTNATVDISGWALFKSGSTCGATPVLVGVIPGVLGSSTTTIPARGHYLITGSAYSLGAVAAGNLTLLAAADIENDRNVGLFATANVLNLSTATRRDAVGFTTNTDGNCALLREGSNLAAASGSVSEYSFARNLTSGTPRDTNNSATDFVLVSITPATPVGDNLTPTLGAPGPENLASPFQRNAVIKAGLIDPTAASTASPNRIRSGAGANPTNAAFGTLDIRRRFTNSTGATVTSLRFRVADMTTRTGSAPPPVGTADLRLLTSANTTANGGTIIITGTTLDAPTQLNGGGLNSSVTVALPGGGLANGAGINVRFLLGVQTEGNFRFLVNVDAIPGPPVVPNNPSPARKGTTGKQQTADGGEVEQPQP